MRLEEEIAREATRLIRKHQRTIQLANEENKRRRRRTTGTVTPVRPVTPARWRLDDGFDPYLVRSRAARISHSIADKMRVGEYRPRHPVGYAIEKPTGGQRKVNVYQVADSALSRHLFESILRKNLPLLSSRAYAYRKDLSAQDAVQYLRSEFRTRSRLYVAEYDFKSYFDYIDHDSIRRSLRDHFTLTDKERSAVESFLEVDGCAPRAYTSEGGPARDRGIPQGTSVSLLLANVAAWQIDRALEFEGVGFVRYADDTLIWSDDYSRLCSAVDLLHEHARAIGVSVNLEKSRGIRLVTNEVAAEMRHTHSITYLGYEIGLDGVHPSADAERRFRQKVESIIWSELLREPSHRTQDWSRLSSSVDRDYVSCIWRLRSYLYGDLSEGRVRKLLSVQPPARKFRGFVASYPLVEDLDWYSRLDGWMLSTLHRALAKRAKLLKASGYTSAFPPPHGVSRSDLTGFKFRSASTGELVDGRVPSLRRMAEVVTRAAAVHGPSDVGRPNPHHY